MQFNPSEDTQICYFCQSNNLHSIIENALYQKYCSEVGIAQEHQLIRNSIEDLLQERKTASIINFKQSLFDDDVEQMRRYYKDSQFNNKVTMLSEYYKFHKDLPLYFDRPLQKILNKYYSKKANEHYKKVKKLVKDQQGISLSSIKSDQQQQSCASVKKSKYSNVLHQLNNNQLQDMCQNISKIINKSPALVQESFIRQQKQICSYLNIGSKTNNNSTQPTDFKRKFLKQTLKKNQPPYQSLKQRDSRSKTNILSYKNIFSSETLLKNARNSKSVNLYTLQNTAKNRISKSIRDVLKPNVVSFNYQSDKLKLKKKNIINNSKDWSTNNKQQKFKKTTSIYHNKQPNVNTKPPRSSSTNTLQRHQSYNNIGTLSTIKKRGMNTMNRQNIVKRSATLESKQKTSMKYLKHQINRDTFETMKIRKISNNKINQLLYNKINIGTAAAEKILKNKNTYGSIELPTKKNHSNEKTQNRRIQKIIATKIFK